MGFSARPDALHHANSREKQIEPEHGERETVLKSTHPLSDRFNFTHKFADSLYRGLCSQAKRGVL